ncbi:MAG: hypothetical protein IPN79_15685 [Saprospiraceae bacterium]|nr:hypothetical protein [Saprospiraceae bacterium]
MSSISSGLSQAVEPNSADHNRIREKDCVELHLGHWDFRSLLKLIIPNFFSTTGGAFIVFFQFLFSDSLTNPSSKCRTEYIFDFQSGYPSEKTSIRMGHADGRHGRDP